MKIKKSLKTKIITSTLIAASVSALVPTYLFMSPVADTIDDLNAQKQQLERQQREYENKQNSLNTDRQRTANEIGDLENQLKSLLDEIHEIDQQSVRIAGQIYQTNVDLERQKEIQKKQYDEMKLRIRYMYENRESSVTESILTSNDMSKLLNSMEYYQKIYDYDRKQLEEIEATRKQIEALKDDLTKELEAVKETENQVRAKRQEVANLVATKQDKMNALDSDIAVIAQFITDAENKKYETESAINAEQARIAADNARKAAEEAARRREEERRKQEAQSGSSSSSNKHNNYRPPSSASGVGARIASIAANNQGVFATIDGYCAQWVSGVYIAAGQPYPTGDAIDFWTRWSYSGSTRMDNIPLGAAVVTSGAGPLAELYGHVGIYIGGGMVASNVGYLKIESVQSFASWATANCRGYRGYIGWVWPNGISLN